MSCQTNEIASTFCCRTLSTLTPIEQRFVDFYDCALESMLPLSRAMIGYGEFGNAQSMTACANKINDYNYLYLYLELLQLERDADKLTVDNPCHLDKGSDFYFQEWSLGCIRKHFMCNNLSIDGILNVYGLMPGQVQNLDGINFMSIEDVLPDDCPDDDNIFTVT